jgi:hypothetical protein
MLFIPVIGIVGLIYKLPETWKANFFKIPTFVTSTACSFVLKLFVHGVMAPYAVIIGDLILYPLFCFWKLSRKTYANFKENKSLKNQNLSLDTQTN